MLGRFVRPALATALFSAVPVLAADPPEQLPAPRPVPGQVVPVPNQVVPVPNQVVPAPVYPVMPPPGNYRDDRRAVWQYYQVDRFGQWRPIVVWGPYGAYYLYNGKPYPWATVNTREVQPKVVGTPYRAP